MSILILIGIVLIISGLLTNFSAQAYTQTPTKGVLLGYDNNAGFTLRDENIFWGNAVEIVYCSLSDGSSSPYEYRNICINGKDNYYIDYRTYNTFKNAYYDVHIIIYIPYKVKTISVDSYSNGIQVIFNGHTLVDIDWGYNEYHYSWTIPDEWNRKEMYKVGYGSNPFEKYASIANYKTINDDYMYVKTLPYSDYVNTHPYEVDYALMFTINGINVDKIQGENYYGTFNSHIYMMSRKRCKEGGWTYPNYSMIELTPKEGLNFSGYIKASDLDNDKFLIAVANYLEDWFSEKNFNVLTDSNFAENNYAIKIRLPNYLFREYGGTAFTEIDENKLKFITNELGETSSQEYAVYLDGDLLKYSIYEEKTNNIPLALISSGIIITLAGVVGMTKEKTVGGRM
jgi:hypothetical protein